MEEIRFSTLLRLEYGRGWDVAHTAVMGGTAKNFFSFTGGAKPPSYRSIQTYYHGAPGYGGRCPAQRGLKATSLQLKMPIKTKFSKTTIPTIASIASYKKTTGGGEIEENVGIFFSFLQLLLEGGL